ncbi:MAG: hypothetical protein A3F83_11500 [Candidatus Glassbacteria bacterium RIFCSPLOWO2_12_FULL_58_11]|uniref:VCBS repeat-containing protein n=1 Tax=Candidatus Glassbacteria bacterium RIFCSPLOWO2_12_FULL_58_11 TaxID=1817867 RepID=A0A1F5YU97_9BACT|nr:MAG: hypothetical protein A3F83_11500 [Candidatus Glassbacteria bacterium RIFCSPLOWO2_12_FULL_58_11]
MSIWKRIRHLRTFSMLTGAVCTSVVLLLGNGCGGGFPPKELAEARITVNRRTLEKKLFFEDSSLNLVTDLRIGNFDADLEEEILVLGSNKACLLKSDGVRKSCLLYKIDNLLDVRAVDLDGDGTQEWLAGGLWGTPSPALLNMHGDVLWKYDAKYKAMGDPGIVDMNNDGTKEIVLYEQSRGLLFFSPAKGLLKELKVSQPVAHLKTGDLDGDGLLELVTSGFDGVMTVRKNTGEIVAQKKLPFSYSDFELVGSDRQAVSQILVAGEDQLYAFGPDLNPVSKLDAPFARYLHVAAGVRLPAAGRTTRGESDEYASILNGRGGWHRSVLYVNESSGPLIYQEILDENFQSICQFRSEGSGTSFLVGGRGKVWLYTPHR